MQNILEQIGKSIIHTYRKCAAKSISCVRNTKGWRFFMWEGISPKSKNAINCVMNDWMLKDLKNKILEISFISYFLINSEF